MVAVEWLNPGCEVSNLEFDSEEGATNLFYGVRLNYGPLLDILNGLTFVK